jgi:hypothetical protein
MKILLNMLSNKPHLLLVIAIYFPNILTMTLVVLNEEYWVSKLANS